MSVVMLINSDINSQYNINSTWIRSTCPSIHVQLINLGLINIFQSQLLNLVTKNTQNANQINIVGCSSD